MAKWQEDVARLKAEMAAKAADNTISNEDNAAADTSASQDVEERPADGTTEDEDSETEQTDEPSTKPRVHIKNEWEEWLGQKLGSKMSRVRAAKAVYINVPKHMLGSGSMMIEDPGTATTSEYQGRHDLTQESHDLQLEKCYERADKAYKRAMMCLGRCPWYLRLEEMEDRKRISRIRAQILQWEQEDYQKDMAERVSGYGPAERARKLRKWAE